MENCPHDCQVSAVLLQDTFVGGKIVELMLFFLTSLFTEPGTQWREQAKFSPSTGTGLCPLAYGVSNIYSIYFKGRLLSFM